MLVDFRSAQHTRISVGCGLLLVVAGFQASLQIACAHAQQRGGAGTTSVGTPGSLNSRPTGDIQLPAESEGHEKQEGCCSPNEKLAAEALVSSWVGNTIGFAHDRHPGCLTGDFNYDRVPDVAIVVHVGPDVGFVDPRVIVENPWCDSELTEIEKAGRSNKGTLTLRCDETHSKSDLALLVLHLTRAKEIRGAFLLLDSVFDDLRVARWGDYHRERTPNGTAGEGTCIYTGTEDAGGLIYWDGNRYRWCQMGD